MIAARLAPRDLLIHVMQRAASLEARTLGGATSTEQQGAQGLSVFG